MRSSFTVKRTTKRATPQAEPRYMTAAVVVAGIVSFVVGWFFVISGGEQLVLFLRARTWATVPAYVSQVDLRRVGNRGSRRVTATYQYEYAGREWVGTRVALARGGDNFSSWANATYTRLASARDRGEPVDCYVNPNRPEQAVLDRTLRLAVLLFQVGLGLPLAALGTLIWTAFFFAALNWIRSRRSPEEAKIELEKGDAASLNGARREKAKGEGENEADEPGSTNE